MKSLENKKLRLLIFSAIGGALTVIVPFVMAYVRELAAISPLCPGGWAPPLPESCSFGGFVIPKLIIIVGLALLIFLLFRKYFKYSFLIIFFVLGYTWYLDRTIVWLHVLMNKIGGLWVYYILLFLLGSLLTFLLYFYFVKLKMWLWLKLFIAIVILLALPLTVLYFDRLLFTFLYPEFGR